MTVWAGAVKKDDWQGTKPTVPVVLVPQPVDYGTVTHHTSGMCAVPERGAGRAFPTFCCTTLEPGAPRETGSRLAIL